jgi:hypothetical protein
MSWKKRIGYTVVVFIIFAAVGNLGGATQSANPVIVELNKPAAELIDKEAEREGEGIQFRGQVQNSRQSGDIFITLWTGPDTPEVLPDTKSGLESSGFNRIRTGTFYFNSDERRWVSFKESDLEEFDSYAFYGFAGEYSAEVENRGETGPVEASLVWTNSDTENQKMVATKTITIQSDSTEEVEFSVREHPRFHYPEKGYDNWEIIVEAQEE